MSRARASTLLALAAFVLAVTAADAKVFLSMEEALKLAFPTATVERKTMFLTTAQKREAQRLP